MSACCKARGDAHFGWCGHVGGPGLPPADLRESILQAEHQRLGSYGGSTTRPRPLLRAVATETEASPQAGIPASRPTGLPVSAQADKPDRGPRPGGELDKDLRVLVRKLRKMNWRYDPKRPSITSPAGDCVRLPRGGHGVKYSAAGIVSQLQKAGARL